MLINEAELYLLDLEEKKQGTIKFLKLAIGEKEILKIIRELHIEYYKKLQRMKEELIERNDELRKKGVSFNERKKLIGDGKFEWLGKQIEKLKKVRLILPPFESWVGEHDYERLMKFGHREYVRFIYQLGYFQ
jgi:hypothetical protein